MTAIIGTNHSPFVRAGRHRCTRRRTLRLLDMENLVGGKVETPLVRTMWSEFVDAIETRYRDHSTVAVSRRNAATAFFALPSNIRRVIGSDQPDGADIALIESIDIDWTAEHYGQVVIGSGDHIFAAVASQLRGAGVHVVQVIGAGSCSTELYHACDEHRYLKQTREAVLARRASIACRDSVSPRIGARRTSANGAGTGNR